MHYTPLQYSTTETRHYCIILCCIQSDAHRRMIDKTELKERRRDKQHVTLRGKMWLESSEFELIMLMSKDKRGRISARGETLIAEVRINAELPHT